MKKLLHLSCHTSSMRVFIKAERESRYPESILAPQRPPRISIKYTKHDHRYVVVQLNTLYSLLTKEMSRVISDDVKGKV